MFVFSFWQTCDAWFKCVLKLSAQITFEINRNDMMVDVHLGLYIVQSKEISKFMFILINFPNAIYILHNHESILNV